MRRIKPLLVPVAATAAVAGGGAAIASADTPGTTSGTTTATTAAPTTTTAPPRIHPGPSQGNGGATHHCPNMGSGTASGSSSSAY